MQRVDVAQAVCVAVSFFYSGRDVFHFAAVRHTASVAVDNLTREFRVPRGKLSYLITVSDCHEQVLWFLCLLYASIRSSSNSSFDRLAKVERDGAGTGGEFPLTESTGTAALVGDGEHTRLLSRECMTVATSDDISGTLKDVYSDYPMAREVV